MLNPEGAGTRINASKLRIPAWRVILATAAALLLAFGIFWLRPWDEVFRPDLPLPDKPSVAVLPFANMSGDQQQEFFADGITDDLITGLSQVSGLFVISRNSTFAYKRKTLPLRQIARELGVQYILEGSVQRSPDKIRINVQLIDGISNGHVWAERFDGSPSDVFPLQDRVTRNVADALAVKLTQEEEKSLSRSETAVPAAYEAFLRGWAYTRRRTPDNLVAAISSFRKAVQLDPRYGRAYAALALTYHSLNRRGWTYAVKLSTSDVHKQTLAYLHQASKYPTGLYYQINGQILEDNGDFETALKQYNQALAEDPSDSLSYVFIANALVLSGRSKEALRYLWTAMRLDPHYPSIYVETLGYAQFCLEDFVQAALAFEEALKLNPEEERVYPYLAATYAYLGRKQDAQTTIARFSEIKISRGGMPPDILDIPYGFSNDGDRDRVTKGLLLAGMNFNAFDEKYAAKYRLRADEIRALFIGHKVHGHNHQQATERSASVSTEGVISMSGDWGNVTGGTLLLEGNLLCVRSPQGAKICGDVFRIPGGTRAKENEYVWREGTFSQIE